MRIWKWVKGLLELGGHMQTVWSVWTWLGVSAMTGVVASLIAYLKQMDGLWIFIAGLATLVFMFGAVVLGHMALTVIRGAAGKFMPLREAARLAYEAVEGSLVSRIAAAKGPEGALHYFAKEVFYAVPVVLGRKCPSTQLRPVSRYLPEAFAFTEGGNAAMSVTTGEIAYKDLCVIRSDFKQALAEIKEAADGVTVSSWDADEKLPLREAVGVAVAETRGSATYGLHVGFGSGEEQIVSGYFSAMLDHKTPIYGKTPPANDWVLLGKVDLSEETLWEMKSIKPHHKPVRITEACRAQRIHGPMAGVPVALLPGRKWLAKNV